MFEMFFGIALLGLIVIAFIGFSIILVLDCIRLWKWQKEYRLRRVSKKMLAELKKFGPLFVVNKKGNVTAVCVWTTFSNYLETWRNRVSENPDVEWGTPIFHVRPTFTFSDDSPFCTGSREAMMDIALDLIYDLLGGRYDRATIKKGIELGDTIIIKDDRLYVPFTGDKWQSEWRGYMNTTVGQAQVTFWQVAQKALRADPK